MSFTLLEDVWPIARKDHQCTVCLGRISPGEKYRRTRFINWDGEPQTGKEHQLCGAAWQHAYEELELYYDESPDWQDDIAPIIRSVLSLMFPAPGVSQPDTQKRVKTCAHGFPDNGVCKTKWEEDHISEPITHDGTCQFGRYDMLGNAVEECHRTDYELVEVGDDVVRLCPKHRSWAASLGVSQPERTEGET